MADGKVVAAATEHLDKVQLLEFIEKQLQDAVKVVVILARHDDSEKCLFLSYGQFGFQFNYEIDGFLQMADQLLFSEGDDAENENEEEAAQ